MRDLTRIYYGLSLLSENRRDSALVVKVKEKISSDL